jgi:hypothetical protein
MAPACRAFERQNRYWLNTVTASLPHGYGCGAEARLVTFAEHHAPGFGAESGEDHDDDGDGARHQGKGEAVIVAVMHGNAGLQRRVDRCDEIAGLIGKSSPMATLTAVISVLKSSAMFLRTNTIKKKSKASSVQPRKLAVTTCF